MMKKQANMSKVAARVVRWEKSLDRLNDQLQATYKAIAAAKEELAEARKAARDGIVIEQTRGGFSMMRDGETKVFVRRSSDRFRDWNAYIGKDKIASYSNGYDMQTDFALCRLAGFDYNI